MGSAAQFSAGTAPLPPLPDLSGAQGTPQVGQDPMAALVANLAPVKQGVDMIIQGAKQVVQSGMVPGAENPCGQIIAAATALLTTAAQQAMQPGQAGPPAGPMQGIPGGAPPPAPGAPA